MYDFQNNPPTEPSLKMDRDLRIELAFKEAEDILLQALAEADSGYFLGWQMLDYPLSSNTFTPLAMRTKRHGAIRLIAVDLPTMAVRDVAL